MIGQTDASSACVGMTDTVEDNKKSHPKRDYQPPELREYGSIRELTASGSSGKRENRGHPERNPRP